MKETKGYTGIPNDLLESLFSVGLSANDMRVALAIIRYTYGYRRECAELSAQFIANAVGLRRDVVGRCVRGLVKNKIVKSFKTESATSPKKLGINTELGEWEITPAVCTYATSSNGTDADSFDDGKMSAYDTDASSYDSDAYNTYDSDACRQTENANSRGDIYANSTCDMDDITGVDTPAHQEIYNNKIINKKVINKTSINEADPYSKEIVMIKVLFETICLSFDSDIKIDYATANKIKLLLCEFTQDEIKRGFEMAEASSYLKGQNSSAWKADFDWIVNPANMSKILSGKYKSRSRITGFDADFDPDEYFRIALERSADDEYWERKMKAQSV